MIHINNFKKNIVGKTRLIKRANKQHADNVNINKMEEVVTSQLTKNDVDLDKLSDSYENSLGKSYRNQEGIYYTPVEVVDAIFDSIEGDVSALTFFDPCCGTGNFLLGAIRRGFNVENIYGADCDDTALKIAKSRIEKKGKQKFYNLRKCDFLVETMNHTSDEQLRYDVVITNPPWGKKYPKEQKKEFSDKFNNGTIVGSSALFTLASIQSCIEGGLVGMLLPDSCSNIATFKSLRYEVLRKKVLVLEDHGKPFKGLLTGAHSVLFENNYSNKTNKVNCISQGGSFKRAQSGFLQNPNYILNFHLEQENADLIDYLYEKKHITLSKGVSWGLGVVTGNNSKFCSETQKPNHEKVYKGADISAQELKNATHFIPSDLKQYQQVAPEKIYRAKEKLAYKFISSNLSFYHDREQKLFLNSANMLVLDESFPVSMKNLHFLLNTELMNYIFKAVFKTHKVLRSDLEKLPIFADYFNAVKKVSEKSLLEYLNIEKHHGTYRIKK